ncbi:hypothetical protein [Paenibacillus tundrae]|uniref:hypothetical protein n=1 Tax=Paenibacillus tundrae TaxID=528187 RepID=UPI0027D8A167|nr:hypothetical protein [Paenibacillus tundrae]
MNFIRYRNILEDLQWALTSANLFFSCVSKSHFPIEYSKVNTYGYDAISTGRERELVVVNEEQIRHAIVRGDAEAMEWVMDQYAGLLWKVAHSILYQASTEEIEECVADTFFTFWQNPD